MKVAVYQQIGLQKIELYSPNKEGKTEGSRFIKYVDLPDYKEEPVEKKSTNWLFERIDLSIGSEKDLSIAMINGRLFHQDDYHKYYSYHGKMYVVDKQFPKPPIGVKPKKNKLSVLYKDGETILAESDYLACGRFTEYLFLGEVEDFPQRTYKPKKFVTKEAELVRTENATYGDEVKFIIPRGKKYKNVRCLFDVEEE